MADVEAKLATGPDGLTDQEARARLDCDGPNEMARGDGTGPLPVLLHQVINPLTPLLLVAAVVTLVLGKYVDAGAITAAVLLNVVIGFVQEYRAEKAMQALARLVAPHARVVRGGAEIDVEARDLVAGDLVVLTSGVRVPADLRLVRALDLEVDESLLTGESLPVTKTIEPLNQPGLTVGDQTNLAFLGTTVTRGRGAGVVVATGGQTELGRIAQAVRTTESGQAPLQRQLAGFVRLIGSAVLGLAVLVFLLGLWAGESLVDMFLTAVAMAVATIPEGLPAVVTIALAVGVRRMARHDAIVRRLVAVETLGSCTVIGSDKTGTLTKNEMMVSQLAVGGQPVHVTGSGYEPLGDFRLGGAAGEPVDLPGSPLLTLALRIGLLANESDLYQEVDGHRVDGDPTEGALIVAALKAGLHPERERERFPLLAQIPFESERQYLASLHVDAGRRLLFVKGAPERVLEACSGQLGNDNQAGPLDPAGVLAQVERLAGDGLRVLALAYKEVPAGTREIAVADAERGLTFVALAGLIDPPRPEALAAIRGCQDAGIRVIMITGDHQVTAQAIGRQLGILGTDGQALTGRELDALSDAELDDRVGQVSVYARVASAHKLRIVQAWRRRGEIVAVTGDGVNDAPALRAAHVGVAMGRGGTDVAREASDIVLTDDNFANIFSAVREGRVVYDNLRKVLLFLIPTGIGLVLTIIGSLLLRLPLPFLPAQALWVNLVTNGLQDVAMAFEPAERDVVQRPPRPPREPLYTRMMIERTLLAAVVIAIGTLAVFGSTLQAGHSLDYARSAALTTLVLFQNFHIGNARSLTLSIFQKNPFSNRFLFLTAATALGIHVLALYWAPLQFVLRTEPLGLESWLLIVLVAASVLVVIEVEKLLRRRLGDR